MFTPTKLVVLLTAALSAVAAAGVPMIYTGDGYFYSTGLGICGITNNDDQDVAAVSHLFFDAQGPVFGGPTNHPICNKTAEVTYQDKTIHVQLTDSCDECKIGDLNFSPHAFSQLADLSEGSISGISWQILD